MTGIPSYRMPIPEPPPWVTWHKGEYSRIAIFNPVPDNSRTMRDIPVWGLLALSMFCFAKAIGVL